MSIINEHILSADTSKFIFVMFGAIMLSPDLINSHSQVSNPSVSLHVVYHVVVALELCQIFALTMWVIYRRIFLCIVFDKTLIEITTSTSFHLPKM